MENFLVFGHTPCMSLFPRLKEFLGKWEDGMLAAGIGSLQTFFPHS